DVAYDNVFCQAASLRARLDGERWSLVELDGVTLTVPEVESEFLLPGEELPTLEWRSDGSLLTGSGGCNRYSGPGVMRGLDLQPSVLASTKRACEPSAVMDREA